MNNFLKNCKVSRVENAATAGVDDLTTDVLDMSGFDSVAFIAILGDVTSGSAIELQVFGNTANSDSSPTPVELTADNVKFTAGASDADNKLLIVDVHRPSYRYVFGKLVIDTQNAVVDGIIAVQYNAKSLPVTQPSSVFSSAFLISA